MIAAAKPGLRASAAPDAAICALAVSTEKLRLAAARAPFGTAEQAWFWTMGSLVARRSAQPPRADASREIARSWTPEDVLKCLDQLYRRRRIDLLHARILRRWGERQVAPSPGRHWEKSDCRIWREAIGRLEWPLRMRGIVRQANDLDLAVYRKTIQECGPSSN